MFDVCVDLDGTIANLDHRLQYIRSKPKNWNAFAAGVYNDGVYEDIVFLVNSLRASGCRIIICSGRSDKTLEDTLNWIIDKSGLTGWDALYMRSEGDYRQDYIIKTELLARMRNDGFNPKMAIDDRTQVVEQCWRANGIRCLQVCDGDF